jgi:serine protease Do
VAAVADGSPAKAAGLRSGDVITGYDGRAIARASDLPRAVAETPVGRTVAITVLREGKPLTLSAAVARLEQPGQQPATKTASTSSLGLSVQAVTPALARELGLDEQRGVLVRGVEDPSPAANAGIKPGDVIVEVDHHTVRSADDLKRAAAQHAKDRPLLFLVSRHGGHLYVAVGA